MAEDKVQVADGMQTRKKMYQPTDSDYEISNIGIDEAENGVVVTCRYRLKEDVKSKLDKQSRALGNGGFYDPYDDGEKHVFENKADAQKFINDELTTMWAENAGE